MQVKLLNSGPPRVHAVILESGEEAVDALTRFAVEQNLAASQISAIGAFSRSVLGFYDLGRRQYRRIPIEEQMEVLSLLGDIALQEGRPKLHVHAVLSGSDGNARGGHLLEAIVRPTLEAVFTESPAYLSRRYDPASGLALIKSG